MVTNFSLVNSKPIEILLVDDSPGDVRLVIESFKENKIKNKLYVVRDGVEALVFLHQEDKYANAPRPDLILLDLNLPKKNGHEVLAEIKSDKSLRRIPVVVMTVSEAEKDIIKAYDLYVNCYVTKPIGLKEFIKVVNSIKNFWFTIVKLPPK